MPASSELEKQLKKATKTGNYVVGRKEVLASLKGSKFLVWSSSANISEEILNQSKLLQIPALRFDGDPIALGKTCGIPFKVSVIAVRSAGDADLNSFSNSRDYTMPRLGLSARITVSEVELAHQEEKLAEKKEENTAIKPKAVESKEKEEKPKKKTKAPKSLSPKKAKKNAKE